MAIEDRSAGWRLAQSWYVLLTLPIFLTSWMAFGYIGFRGRKAKWWFWGAVYLGLLVFFLAQPSEIAPDGTRTSPTWVGAGLFAAWIVSVIHAFRTRREFLTILDEGYGGTPAYAQPADPYAALRAPGEAPPPRNDYAVFTQPQSAAPQQQPVAAPPPPYTPPHPPPPPAAWPPVGPAAAQPPAPAAVPPPPPPAAPRASEPPPPPFSGPAPFGGSRPFEEDEDRTRPAPPPPPRRPGRQIDY